MKVEEMNECDELRVACRKKLLRCEHLRLLILILYPIVVRHLADIDRIFRPMKPYPERTRPTLTSHDASLPHAEAKEITTIHSEMLYSTRQRT